MKTIKSLTVVVALLAAILLCAVTTPTTRNIKATWNASTNSNVIGYNVYYGTNMFYLTNRVFTTNLSATISNLSLGSTVFLSICATNGLANSLPLKGQKLIPYYYDLVIDVTGTDLESTSDLNTTNFWTALWRNSISITNPVDNQFFRCSILATNQHCTIATRYVRK